jgi:hypothetical protein
MQKFGVLMIFLEDKYYVGKRVDAVFNGGSIKDFYNRYFSLGVLR